MKKTNQRKIWVDYARICAILCVILCHATESFYGGVMKGREEVTFTVWLVENTLFTIGRIGVPVFVAITGFLMLGREIRPGDFYKRSLLPLAVTTEFWIVLNMIFVCTVQKEPFVLENLILEMLFLRAPELSHMWYMPMILGMYVAMPFLARIPLIFQEKKDYLLPGLLTITACMIVPTISVFLKEAVPGNHSISSQLELGFLGGTYGIYLFSGYFIGKKKVLEKRKTVELIFFLLLAFGANTAGQYYLYSHQYFESNRLLWYTSFFIFVMGILMFELIRRSGEHLQNISPILNFMARCSFGLYLLHKPIQILSMKYLPMGNAPVLIRILFLFLTGSVLSLFILFPFYLYGKKVGKLIFFIKQ